VHGKYLYDNVCKICKNMSNELIRNKINKIMGNIMKDFIINRLKKFTIEDLMRCILGLQEIEIRVYFDLLENGEGSVLEIAERVNRDRTTVQKALRSLMNCGLVSRKKVTEKVGYKYIYNAVELDKVSDIIEELLDDWYQNVKKWLGYFRESRNKKNY